MRALVGIVRLLFTNKIQFKEACTMFLSDPTDLRGSRCSSDVFLDPIYKKISERSVMVERPTLRKWDLHSLLSSKDVIFRYILITCSLKLAPSLWRSPK